jgi:hypothetical protein
MGEQNGPAGLGRKQSVRFAAIKVEKQTQIEVVDQSAYDQPRIPAGELRPIGATGAGAATPNAGTDRRRAAI